MSNLTTTKEGVVDLQDFILSDNIKPFRALQDIAKFKDFKLDYILKWGDDLDLTQEYLYCKAFEAGHNLTAKFQEWGYI